jgi:hypothetical protein
MFLAGVVRFGTDTLPSMSGAVGMGTVIVCAGSAKVNIGAGAGAVPAFMTYTAVPVAELVSPERHPTAESV